MRDKPDFIEPIVPLELLSAASDIFVKLETPKMFDLIGIKNDLENLLGKKVDIILLGKLVNKYLLNQIRQVRICRMNLTKDFILKELYNKVKKQNKYLHL